MESETPWAMCRFEIAPCTFGRRQSRDLPPAGSHYVAVGQNSLFVGRELLAQTVDEGTHSSRQEMSRRVDNMDVGLSRGLIREQWHQAVRGDIRSDVPDRLEGKPMACQGPIANEVSASGD